MPAATTVSYFGYGSLVNDATRPPGPAARRASLFGFRRAWRVRGGEACALTVVPAPGSAVRGLVVTEPAENLAALDRREARYRRAEALPAGVVVDDASPPPSPLYYYAVDAAHEGPGDAACPILLSYVDCVLQGFLRHWGEAGVADFMASTDGWDVPVLDDRAAPRYVRAQVLTAGERELVDRALDAAGARRLAPTVAAAVRRGI